MSEGSRPFFSIGLTTYNRPKLLKEVVDSILRQTFSDFEVILGNDYTPDVISKEKLGIADDRIKIINHPVNLGEVGNMNFLLRESRGRYFTWMGDDDLYHSRFLESAHHGITANNFPTCLFTNYEIVNGLVTPEEKDIELKEGAFSGAEFLRGYLANQSPCIGCYGVFDRENLLKIGGVTSLTQAPIGLYGEYMLMTRVGLFQKVVYLNSPLIYYRSHSEIATPLSSLMQFKEASSNLIFNAVRILERPELNKDFVPNFSFFIKLFFGHFYNRIYKEAEAVTNVQIVSYMMFLQEKLRGLKARFYILGSLCLIRQTLKTLWFNFKGQVRSLLLKR